MWSKSYKLEGPKWTIFICITSRVFSFEGPNRIQRSVKLVGKKSVIKHPYDFLLLHFLTLKLSNFSQKLNFYLKVTLKNYSGVKSISLNWHKWPPVKATRERKKRWLFLTNGNILYHLNIKRIVFSPSFITNDRSFCNSLMTKIMR